MTSRFLDLCLFWGGQEAEAEIYSLSTDSWRKVVISMESLRGYEPNFGTIADTDRTCIFFNGALHTVAITSRHHFILPFDVNDESFREIMLPPNHLDGVRVNFAELAVFKGSLAVFVFVHGRRDILCHIWVMEEYGVAESWTRKYLVPKNWVSDGYFYGCTDNAELLIESGTTLVSIDPESQNQNILAIEDADWMRFTANSMESLILLDGD
ncbi:F-box/kelch-repeat protein At3g06240-like [Castanea sativa]|uniref:F-box/kelch-repeat protein At3g06240-like n=1 Tax=Castanea sativa TaxID=21020 RepID=UPI003F64BE33